MSDIQVTRLDPLSLSHYVAPRINNVPGIMKTRMRALKKQPTIDSLINRRYILPMNHNIAFSKALHVVWRGLVAVRVVAGV
jgi:hypothetical protein